MRRLSTSLACRVRDGAGNVGPAPRPASCRLTRGRDRPPRLPASDPDPGAPAADGCYPVPADFSHFNPCVTYAKIGVILPFHYTVTFESEKWVPIHVSGECDAPDASEAARKAVFRALPAVGRGKWESVVVVLRKREGV